MAPPGRTGRTTTHRGPTGSAATQGRRLHDAERTGCARTDGGQRLHDAESTGRTTRTRRERRLHDAGRTGRATTLRGPTGSGATHGRRLCPGHTRTDGNHACTMQGAPKKGWAQEVRKTIRGSLGGQLCLRNSIRGPLHQTFEYCQILTATGFHTDTWAAHRDSI